jgi:iron(III) transport system substrate-binding protein
MMGGMSGARGRVFALLSPAALLPAAVLAAALAGCARSAGPSAELDIYAAQGQEITTPLIDVYQRKNPALRINVIRGGAGELLSRLRAEKAGPLGDVFWGGALELYRVNADLFAPLDIADEAAFETSDPQKKWHPWTRNVLHLAVNTRRVPDDVPRSLKDLALPKWAARGRIGMSNPASSGTAYTIVPALVTVHGWDYMAALLKNVRLTDSSETSFKWLKDGEVAAGFIFEKMLLDYVAAGAPLKLVVPEEGVIQQADGCGLVAGAPHPGPAADFLRWMSSKEAHEVVRATLGRRSLRKDTAPSPGLMDLTGVKLIQADVDWITNHRDEILKQFEEARARASS